MGTLYKSMPLTLHTLCVHTHRWKTYTSKKLNKIWHKAGDESGIKIKMYNGVHHSLECQMLEMGAPLDVVQDQLGHQTFEMTRRYAKGSINVRKEYLEKPGKVDEYMKEANI